jgi:1-acyl-sn-glycerol-3-phosphate acyltransferase
MTAETIARATLVGYCLIIFGAVLWRALSWPHGWRLWLLWVIGNLYMRLGFHWRANRRCPFLDENTAIVIANHRSPPDPLIVWVGITNGRPIECMAAQEYFGIPGIRFIMQNMRAIPVARNGKDMAATREALRRLKVGCYLGVFPEGRINRGKGFLPWDTGLAWLALHSQAPVYPVFIHNAPQADDMVSPCYTFNHVRVTYGDPVDLSAYYGKRINGALLEEVTDLLRNRLADLGGLELPQKVEPEVDRPPAILRMPQAAG